MPNTAASQIQMYYKYFVVHMMNIILKDIIKRVLLKVP